MTTKTKNNNTENMNTSDIEKYIKTKNLGLTFQNIKSNIIKVN